MSDQEILDLLKEIRELLIPISACFEEQYNEIRRQKLGAKLEVFRKMMTPVRKAIFPLLFDSRKLSQAEIAEIANTTQPTVSRLISSLLEQDLIGQLKDADGYVWYEDKHGLLKELESEGEIR